MESARRIALLFALGSAACAGQEAASVPPPAATEAPAPNHAAVGEARMPRAVAGERPELASIEGLLCFEGGRVREPEELLGLSDVLAEALYYGGPTSLSGREFHERLAARGASLEVRATDDALELEFRTPPGELASVLDAAAELARFPHYPPEIVELARERLIDRLEAEADDPSAIADAELAELVFGSDDPFVRRASCATAERIGRGELLAFHRAHVGRDRLWAAAVGPIDSATLEREVARAFAGLPVVGPVEPLPETRYATAGLRGVVFSEGTTIEQRLWSPGIAFTHPDYAAMRIWSDVVGRRAEGGAFFQVRWTGPVGLFGFVSSPPDEAIARAKRIELENYVEGPALDPIAPELFEAARTRVLEAHASAEGSARSLLEPLRYGADPGFWKQHGASLAAATPETVAEAARRCVLPSSWITVGVFPEPPTEWESFADKRWRWPVVDGTRPLRGNPEAVAVLERLFAALGGRTAWAALEGLALEGEVRFSEQGEPFAVAIWRDLAGERLRIEEDRGGTERVQIATPAGALAIEGGTVEPLHEDVHAAVVARERALLYRVLRELARATTHSVELDGDGRLAVRRRGRPLCAIEIGPDGLPARVNVPESSLERARATEYLDWAPHGSAGLFFARETRDGPTQADARRFLWRSIDPDWAPSDASFSAE